MVSLTEMNTRNKDERDAAGDNGEQAVPVEVLRREYTDKGAIVLPLVMTRRDMKDLRYHIMRLQSKGRVDIQDDRQFTPPIRLHRRDPRAPPSGAGAQYEEEDTKEDLEEIKERERIEIAKEERRKVREENQSKIAPTGVKKTPAFQKKLEQKFRPDNTPEAEKRRLLKYEETLPWHLEDFDNKQTWVGVYESELSESHVMLTTAFENGRDVVQMVPLERWYKFAVKGKVKQTTVDQVEEKIVKQEKLPKFLTNIEKMSMKRELDHEKLRTARMWTRSGAGDDDEGAPPRRQRLDDDDMPRVKREADADDIDFNMEEDFADDEEGLNGLLEGEETDVKDATERLKRDMLAAAAFDLRNEDEVYREEERAREEAEKQRQLEKSIRKALTKREKNPDYDTDRSNPYESSSDESDDDSETERRKAKEEEERKAAEQNGKADADKTASGSSTKGSNTPSGSHRPVDVNKKKRPGSPNLSEASGNESSRKKHKKKHDKATDASRNTDSEMTDVSKSRTQKLKVRMGNGSTSGSPGGSRAGSPAAPQLNGSRAGSPAGPAASQRRFPPSAKGKGKDIRR
jgi:transcription initiation factor TFIIF subunit alpha